MNKLILNITTISKKKKEYNTVTKVTCPLKTHENSSSLPLVFDKHEPKLSVC
jgi:hypothetical protein